MFAAAQGCPICGSDTVEKATIRSDFSRVEFFFRCCEACGLVFVANPRLDFAALYDAAYYRGEGADSFVQYTEEMVNPDTIRAYEWRGITRAVRSLCNTSEVRWLDFGCGLGGLVRYFRTSMDTTRDGGPTGLASTKSHCSTTISCAIRRGRSTS